MQVKVTVIIFPHYLKLTIVAVSRGADEGPSSFHFPHLPLALIAFSIRMGQNTPTVSYTINPFANVLKTYKPRSNYASGIYLGTITIITYLLPVVTGVDSFTLPYSIDEISAKLAPIWVIENPLATDAALHNVADVHGPVLHSVFTSTILNLALVGPFPPLFEMLDVDP
jgi:hypothetical protein